MSDRQPEAQPGEDAPARPPVRVMGYWRNREVQPVESFDSDVHDTRPVSYLETWLGMMLHRVTREVRDEGVALVDLLQHGVTVTIRRTADGHIEVDMGGHYERPGS